jgi:prepilin-type N-terminal cleavage/methylation domain-containing protein
MLNHRLLFRTARKLSRGGFTLVELLVVIGIIAILAGVALGPITSGIEKAKESAGLQTARSINLLLFQYSTDNNNVYPVGGTSGPGTGHGIAIQLLQNKYANDPTIFALLSNKYTGSSTDFSDFAASNISWDFTGVQGSPVTGITSASSDLVPSVFCTGETIPAYAPSTQLNLTLSGSGPFAKNGIAVAYKGNSAFFLKGTLSGSGAVVNNFISQSFNDTASYVQIKP